MLAVFGILPFIEFLDKVVSLIVDGDGTARADTQGLSHPRSSIAHLTSQA